MKHESQLARLGLFDARVPRYTSYPTAPHFSTAVGAPKFVEWIEAIPAGASISLYVHVPFCRRLCWFCACRTQGTQSDAPVRSYAETLVTELAMLKRHLAPGVKLSRLHWGGGTATLLPAESMRKVAAAVFDAVPLGADGEFSVEIDPNEIDDERMDALAESGMNGFEAGAWQGVMVPAGTPAPIIERLNQAFLQALKNPTVLEKLRIQGTEPLGSTPAEYGAYIEKELARWASVVKSTGVSLD